MSAAGAGPTLEDGFTMVELMVALVLGAVVMTMIFGVVLDMFGASERSAMEQKAQKSATLASEMLTADVRAMRAPQREPIVTGSPDNLRSLILDGNPQGLRIHDLTFASPTRITFYAELVNTSPGAECVTWFVDVDRSLQRVVRAGTPQCATAGTVRQRQLVMPPPEVARASGAAKVPDPFSFRLLRVANRANPNPDTCTTPTVAGGTLDPLQRDQVTNVTLDLRSFVAGRTASGDQRLQTSVTITSRQNLEYRYGLGCAV